MTETVALPVIEVLGYKLTNDEDHVLVGFKQPSGEEFSLALDQSNLLQSIATLISATSAYPFQAGFSEKQIGVFQTDWYEVGLVPGSTDFSIRFRLDGGGHLSFVMNKAMTERLAETLSVALGGESKSLPPGTLRN